MKRLMIAAAIAMAGTAQADMPENCRWLAVEVESVTDNVAAEIDDIAPTVLRHGADGLADGDEYMELAAEVADVLGALAPFSDALAKLIDCIHTGNG